MHLRGFDVLLLSGETQAQGAAGGCCCDPNGKTRFISQSRQLFWCLLLPHLVRKVAVGSGTGPSP